MLVWNKYIYTHTYARQWLCIGACKECIFMWACGAGYLKSARRKCETVYIAVRDF